MATRRRCERAFKYLGHFTPSVSPNHNISTDFCQLQESTPLGGPRADKHSGEEGRGRGQYGRRPSEGASRLRPNEIAKRRTGDADPQRGIISAAGGQFYRLMSLTPPPPPASEDGGKMIHCK